MEASSMEGEEGLTVLSRLYLFRPRCSVQHMLQLLYTVLEGFICKQSRTVAFLSKTRRHHFASSKTYLCRTQEACTVLEHSYCHGLIVHLDYRDAYLRKMPA